MSRTVNITDEIIVVSHGEEDTGKMAMLGANGKFHTSVIPVIDDLQDQITKEVTARGDGDKQVQANLDAETNARTSTDNDLQNQITKEVTARTEADKQLQDNLDAEVTARTNADIKLQGNIEVEATARDTADKDLQEQLTKEIATRTNGDAVLQTSIDTETSARTATDQQLQEQITKEETARSDADVQLKSSVDAEASARTAADNNLQNQMTSEVSARTDADSKLQSSINAEVNDRVTADQGLQGQITAEVAARTNADEIELNARSGADQNLQKQIDVLNNKNVFSNVMVNGTTIAADSPTDTLELTAGTNIELSADTANEKVTIGVIGKVASAAQADAANKLMNAHTINGMAFDGSADIMITQIDGKNIATIDQIPTILPANGGNADTLDGKHASDFISASNAYLQSLSFSANTDRASIYFESTGDEDGKSNLIIETGDNNTESVIFRHTPCDGDEYDFCKISPKGTIVLKGDKQVATTDQIPVASASVPIGGIMMWSGAITSIPSGWNLCNGTNSTPDLRDRFILGAGQSYAVGATGGEATHTLTIAEMPSHNHGGVPLVVTDVDRGSGSSLFSIDNISYTESTGGNDAHNNMPPYYALAYIMRIA